MAWSKLGQAMAGAEVTGGLGLGDGREGRRCHSVKADGGETVSVQTDVSKEADVQEMLQAAVDAYGTVNVLVNDATASVFGAIEDVTREDWQRVMGVNVFGSSSWVKHPVPVMALRRFSASPADSFVGPVASNDDHQIALKRAMVASRPLAAPYCKREDWSQPNCYVCKIRGANYPCPGQPNYDI